MKLLLGLCFAVLLGGCGPAIPRPATAVPVPVPASARPAGPPILGAVNGQSARGLIASFGQPAADVQEGTGRKLQFTGPICVLDAYLYPAANGRGDPVVTFADTRQRNGAPIDQASCVASLIKRPAR